MTLLTLCSLSTLRIRGNDGTVAEGCVANCAIVTKEISCDCNVYSKASSGIARHEGFRCRMLDRTKRSLPHRTLEAIHWLAKTRFPPDGISFLSGFGIIGVFTANMMNCY